MPADHPLPGHAAIGPTLMRPLAFASAAVAGLLAVYFIVLTLVSGWDATAAHFAESWYFLVPLATSFGLQVGLYMYLGRQATGRRGRRVVATTGTTSTAVMVSCCTHYLANAFPVFGVTGIITLIADYQIQLFWLGLACNVAGLAYIALHKSSVPDRRRLLSRYWHSAAGFWRGRRAWSAWTLTASLVAIALLQLLIQYRLNVWNRDFFNALEHRDGATLWAVAAWFLPLVASSMALAALAVRGRMRLQRKWREALTVHIASYWLLKCRYGRLDYAAMGNKNPEYRIADDTRAATDAPIDLALGLLSSMLAGVTFIGVLWSVGGSLGVTAFGFSVTVPGYLVVGVIGYSTLVTGTMMIIGRPLTRVIQDLNQAEAELRAAATVLREVGEETAAPSTEPKQRRTFWMALRHAINQWQRLARQLTRTTLVSQANVLIVPVAAWLLCSPKYLSGAMSLGELTQAAAAFVIVQGAFNWLVDNYQRVADWRSAASRVATLLVALDDLACTEQPFACQDAGGASAVTAPTLVPAKSVTAVDSPGVPGTCDPRPSRQPAAGR